MCGEIAVLLPTSRRFLSSSTGRFILVGTASTLVNYGVFSAMFGFDVFNYVAASIAGYVTGFLFGYAFNRSWTFSAQDQKAHGIRTFTPYLLLYAISLVASITFLKILVEHLGISPLIANACAIAFSVIMNYSGCRWVVFHSVVSAKWKSIAPYIPTVFWIAVAIKLASSAAFGSPFLTEGFLPFIRYFVETLQNPYMHFPRGDAALGFPYPAGMLAVMSAPFFLLWGALPLECFSSLSLSLSLHYSLLIARLPILGADILIYFILCRLLPTKERWVFWLYFASPVLFYINYFHGQLDVIPTALLFLSLYFVLKKSFIPAFALLGIGLAAKTHLLIAIPFLWIYLSRNGMTAHRIAGLTSIAALVFVVLNAPAWSPEFAATVLNNPEKRRLFTLPLPFTESGLRFLLAPAALLLIFYRLSNFQRLNQGSLLLALGLAFIVLVLLVPPMPGWLYWSLPFLILFVSKYRHPPLLAFITLSLSYLGYVFFGSHSDVFESLSPSFPSLAELPLPSAWLSVKGISTQLVENIFFTIFESSLFISALWSYQTGIRVNERYQAQHRRIAIGIAGDSGVGKSTLASAITKLIGQDSIVWLRGDDMHKWERHDPHWTLVTHLHPKANRLHVDLDHAASLLQGETIERPGYDHRDGFFTSPTMVAPKQFIGAEGLHSFLIDRLRSLYDVKIYVEADEGLCIAWKVARDAEERGHAAESVRAQIASRREDAEKFIVPQKETANWVIRYRRGEDGGLEASHMFTNSIAIEPLLEQLEQHSSLTIAHDYLDIHHQRIVATGSIASEDVRMVAYMLFPHLHDLLGGDAPKFVDGILGVYQLLFVAFLDHLAKSRLHHESLH